jgi:Ca2+-dependent lipid-binding protein
MYIYIYIYIHTHTNDRSGTSDPFVTVTVGQHSFKTDVIKKTLSPVWSATRKFDEVRGTDMLVLKVCMYVCMYTYMCIYVWN